MRAKRAIKIIDLRLKQRMLESLKKPIRCFARLRQKAHREYKGSQSGSGWRIVIFTTQWGKALLFNIDVEIWLPLLWKNLRATRNANSNFIHLVSQTTGEKMSHKKWVCFPDLWSQSRFRWQPSRRQFCNDGISWWHSLIHFWNEEMFQSVKTLL